MVRYKIKNNLPTLRTELKYVQASLKTIQVNSVQKTNALCWEIPENVFQTQKMF